MIITCFQHKRLEKEQKYKHKENRRKELINAEQTLINQETNCTRCHVQLNSAWPLPVACCGLSFQLMALTSPHISQVFSDQEPTQYSPQSSPEVQEVTTNGITAPSPPMGSRSLSLLFLGQKCLGQFYTHLNRSQPGQVPVTHSSGQQKTCTPSSPCRNRLMNEV